MSRKQQSQNRNQCESYKTYKKNNEDARFFPPLWDQRRYRESFGENLWYLQGMQLYECSLQLWLLSRVSKKKFIKVLKNRDFFQIFKYKVSKTIFASLRYFDFFLFSDMLLISTRRFDLKFKNLSHLKNRRFFCSIKNSFWLPSLLIATFLRIFSNTKKLTLKSLSIKF